MKEHNTLPVATASNKVKIFKEGAISWQEMTNAFMNRDRLDNIKAYVQKRSDRLMKHLKRPPVEQKRVAELCANNDMHLKDPSFEEGTPNAEELQYYEAQMQ